MTQREKEERITKMAKKLKIKLTGSELKPYTNKTELRKKVSISK